jgi:hypothetical protein
MTIIPLGPEKRSPGAFSRYRELVETYNRSPVALAQDIRVTDAGLSWSRLTALEAEIFGIEPRLLHALAWAYIRYSNLTGVLDLEFDTFRDRERLAYEEFFHGERVYSIEAAIGFMATACRLPIAQTMLYVCRAQVQYVRSGVVGASDDPPGWALGRLSDKSGSRFATSAPGGHQPVEVLVQN